MAEDPDGPNSQLEACLRLPPGGHVPPPVVTRSAALPVGSLAWPDFERLCLRLLELEAAFDHCQAYGTPGQDQQGIDLYGRLPDGIGYVVVQSRRVRSVTAGSISGAVGDFLEGTWSERASKFVYATTASLAATSLAEEIERQAARLSESEISFATWDVDRISEKLRRSPELVAEFFGPAWCDAFCVAPPAPTAEAASTREIVSRYRARVQDRGEHLDLRAIGLDIPRIKVPWSGREPLVSPLGRPSDESGSGISARAALRRCGRLVLIGPPGGGKSTVLRAIAADWARDDSSPLPLVVPVGRLQDRVADFQSEILRVGLANEPHEDADDLRRAFSERLANGDFLVLIDGLDEAGDRRHRLAAALSGWLALIHPAVEVVVSTRDWAYASAQTLDLPGVSLMMPAQIERFQRSLLELLGAASGVPQEDRGDWISERLRWLADFRRENRNLTKTPLINVLICVLSAGSEVMQLRWSRPQVVARMVDEVAARLELTQRREGATPIAALPGSPLPALLQAFEVAAHALIDGDQPATLLCGLLARYFEVAWGLPPGQADAVAADARRFWDEAGVFSEFGFPEVVTASSRVLVEVGEARWVARQESADQRSWVASSIWRPDLAEAVVLGAGLSRSVAACLVDVALGSAGKPPLLLAARAVAEGASVSEASILALGEALRVFIRVPGPDDAASALARLPLPASGHDAATRAFEDFDEPHAAVLKAIAAGSWIGCSTEARRGWWSQLLAVESVGRGWMKLHGEGLIRAAEGLLPGSVEVAEALLHASEEISAGDHESVSRLVAAHGHGDLVRALTAARLEDMVKSVTANAGMSAQAWEVLLSLLREAEPRVMSALERRRLNHLADFMTTTTLNHASYRWFLQIPRARDDVRMLLSAIVELGAFDQALLSAQARETAVLDETSGSELLFDYATRMGLRAWPESPNERASRVQEIAGCLGREPIAAHLAALILSQCPEKELVLAAVRPMLSRLTRDSQEVTAYLILEMAQYPAHEASEWVAGESVPLGRIGARALGILFCSGEATAEQLLVALQHKDLLTRSAALRALEKCESAQKILVEEMVLSTPVDALLGWQCPKCGLDYLASEASCKRCRVIYNDWASWTMNGRKRRASN